MTKIGKALYQYVFKDIEPYIKDKKELYIIPGSMIAYLPFETFIMPDGRYLIEKYDIHYAQSLGVQNMLNKLNYPKKRMSIMAFGNPVYEKIEYKNEEEEAQATLDFYYKNGGNIHETELGNYIAYGYGPNKWQTLLATQGEVDAIKKEFRDALTFTGADASKGNLKKLSADGSLKKYSMLHFATHGLVIPEKPELSALVLSQEKGSDDIGYLSMTDVASLNLQADFVNLSACETGLGKYYTTEGIVGLSQAFILAGAKSVSVSLWSIQDESTREFMTDFYRLVDSGIPYAKALSETKRKFIKEGKYSNPFYWAPFVFYGSSSSKFIKEIVELDANGKETVTDADGNVYSTVRIADQVWTTENLRTTKFNDGTNIPMIVENDDWSQLKSPAFCYYKNTKDKEIIIKYGALYNWYTVDSKKIAPKGWHVPTRQDWINLENYLLKNGYRNYSTYVKGANTIAKALAAKIDWKKSEFEDAVGSNVQKNNSIGFNGLPIGMRCGLDLKGKFYFFGEIGAWWSADLDEKNTNYAVGYMLRNDGFELNNRSDTFNDGLSIRLIKD